MAEHRVMSEDLLGISHYRSRGRFESHAMEQETGIGSIYDEFSRGYGAEIRLFCPDFRPNSTYKPTSTTKGLP
jgi:hypothetical protein